jgi:hypothetical protein
VELTVGAVVSAVAPVVKVQTKGLANELPDWSLAPVVIVAVNRVLIARLLAGGANVATLHAALQVTAPATFVPPPTTVKVAVVMVKGSMDLLKVAVIFLLTGIPVAPLAGFVEVTVGGSKFTVNVCGPLVPIEVVTVTFWAPVGAFRAMVNVAVIDVLLTTVVLLTVMPVPLRPIVAPAAKSVPVSVTATVCPSVPELGLTEVSEGAGFTVNACEALVLPALVTVTFWAPVGAF